MNRSTFSTSVPTRKKNWHGNQVWPPVNLASSGHGEEASPGPEATEPTTWDVVLSSLVGKMGVFNNRNYAAPVDALYKHDMHMTEPTYFCRSVSVEKLHLREQNLRTREPRPRQLELSRQEVAQPARFQLHELVVRAVQGEPFWHPTIAGLR